MDRKIMLGNSGIFLRCADEFRDRCEYEKALLRVGEERAAKVRKYKNEDAALMSLAAGMAFSDGLSSYGIKREELVFYEGEHGKPYIRRTPELYFNISHSGNIAVCAFSDREIGVDIEKIEEMDFKSIMKRFTDVDRRYVDEGDASVRFKELWTFKESFVKCIGTGIADLGKIPSIKAGSSFEIEHEDENFRVFRYKPLDGYVLTLCERKGSAEKECSL